MLVFPITARIQNTTVAQNTSGGLLVGLSVSPLEINSTIIAGNLPVDVEGVGGGSPVHSLGHNLIGIGNLATAFVGPGDMMNILDPGLEALAFNGGPTPTHALRSDSLARDHGSNPFGLIYDQRGAPYVRVVGPQADVGAFEAPLGLPGDFNHDGHLDCADINSLVFAIVYQPHDLTYDLSGDGEVNLADLDLWLAVAGAAPGSPTGGNPFLYGDANLDGVVDGQDFIAWNAHKFTNIAAWCAGDFTADGVVDGQDFIQWNTNKFRSAQLLGQPEVAATNGVWKPQIMKSVALMPSAKQATDMPVAARHDVALSLLYGHRRSIATKSGTGENRTPLWEGLLPTTDPELISWRS